MECKCPFIYRMNTLESESQQFFFIEFKKYILYDCIVDQSAAELNLFLSSFFTLLSLFLFILFFYFYQLYFYSSIYLFYSFIYLHLSSVEPRASPPSLPLKDLLFSFLRRALSQLLGNFTLRQNSPAALVQSRAIARRGIREMMACP